MRATMMRVRARRKPFALEVAELAAGLAADRVIERLERRGILSLLRDHGSSSPAGKEPTCRDDETNDAAFSGRMPEAAASTASSKLTPQQESDLRETIRARRRRRTQSR
jgi:hypothetical protein